MTVKDFADKYFLHDSGIEEINYDDAGRFKSGRTAVASNRS